jgi:hypothetical protein
VEVEIASEPFGNAAETTALTSGVAAHRSMNRIPGGRFAAERARSRCCAEHQCFARAQIGTKAS